MTNTKITNPIEEYRVLNQYTQVQFSELLGMSRNTYLSRINGKSLWKAPEITRLIKLTNKDYSELFLSE